MTQRQSQGRVLGMQKFARLCETTPRTIRFYQQVGLLKPSYVDPFTKYRYFYPEQARDVFRIKLLQSFHIPLKQIKELLLTQGTQSFLGKRVQLIAEEMQEKKKQLAFLQEIKEFVVEERKKSKKLKMEFVGPYTLLCTFVKQGRYSQISEISKKLFLQAQKLGIATQGRDMTFYHDPNHYRPGGSPLEIGIICKSILLHSNILLPNNLYVKKFARQKVLVYTYKGPFEYLTFIHQRMVALTPSAGSPRSDSGQAGQAKKMSGFPFDIAVHGPWDKKSVYDYVTLVGYPLPET